MNVPGHEIFCDANTNTRRKKHVAVKSYHIANPSTMLRLASTSSSRLLRSRCTARLGGNKFSTKATNPLEADSGSFGTHIHHSMMAVLAVATPLYFMVPDEYSDGALNKLFGVALSFYIAGHSWIGLNYVCVDYVPKISKSLLGPSRYVSAGLAGVTLLGLLRISVQSKGGIKGMIKGLWNPKKAEK